MRVDSFEKLQSTMAVATMSEDASRVPLPLPRLCALINKNLGIPPGSPPPVVVNEGMAQLELLAADGATLLAKARMVVEALELNAYEATAAESLQLPPLASLQGRDHADLKTLYMLVFGASAAPHKCSTLCSCASLFLYCFLRARSNALALLPAGTSGMTVQQIESANRAHALDVISKAYCVEHSDNERFYDYFTTYLHQTWPCTQAKTLLSEAVTTAADFHDAKKRAAQAAELSHKDARTQLVALTGALNTLDAELTPRLTAVFKMALSTSSFVSNVLPEAVKLFGTLEDGALLSEANQEKMKRLMKHGVHAAWSRSTLSQGCTESDSEFIGRGLVTYDKVVDVAEAFHEWAVSESLPVLKSAEPTALACVQDLGLNFLNVNLSNDQDLSKEFKEVFGETIEVGQPVPEVIDDRGSVARLFEDGWLSIIQPIPILLLRIYLQRKRSSAINLSRVGWGMGSVGKQGGLLIDFWQGLADHASSSLVEAKVRADCHTSGKSSHKCCVFPFPPL